MRSFSHTWKESSSKHLLSMSQVWLICRVSKKEDVKWDGTSVHTFCFLPHTISDWLKKVVLEPGEVLCLTHTTGSRWKVLRLSQERRFCSTHTTRSWRKLSFSLSTKPFLPKKKKRQYPSHPLRSAWPPWGGGSTSSSPWSFCIIGILGKMSMQRASKPVSKDAEKSPKGAAARELLFLGMQFFWGTKSLPWGHWTRAEVKEARMGNLGPSSSSAAASSSKCSWPHYLMQSKREVVTLPLSSSLAKAASQTFPGIKIAAREEAKEARGLCTSDKTLICKQDSGGAGGRSSSSRRSCCCRWCWCCCSYTQSGDRERGRVNTVD